MCVVGKKGSRYLRFAGTFARGAGGRKCTCFLFLVALCKLAALSRSDFVPCSFFALSLSVSLLLRSNLIQVFPTLSKASTDLRHNRGTKASRSGRYILSCSSPTPLTRRLLRLKIFLRFLPFSLSSLSKRLSSHEPSSHLSLYHQTLPLRHPLPRLPIAYKQSHTHTQTPSPIDCSHTSLI